jgi:hypothetical protein
MSPSDEVSIAHANELYDRIKELSRHWNSVDDDIARRIIELADDAIKEFGSTNQDKKVELRKIRIEAERILPPATFEELKKRGEGHLLQKSLRNRRTVKYLPLIFVIGIILIPLIVFGIGYFKAQPSKTIEPQNEADQLKQTTPSGTVSQNQASSVDGIDEAAIAASSSSFSPISMSEFFNTAISMSLTDLQRTDFISQQSGRRVIWEGAIATVNDDRDKISVGLTDYKSDFVYIAFFSFPPDHRSDFVALKPGQRVRITGILREWHVTNAQLDSSRIIKIWPFEDPTTNKNGK